jgi:hypothetical protein
VTRMLRCSLGLSLLWTRSKGLGISTTCGSHQHLSPSHWQVSGCNAGHSLLVKPLVHMLEQAAVRISAWGEACSSYTH